MGDDDDLVAVKVLVDGEPWTRISSLAEAGPDDKVYVLNLEDGTLVFGDGVHGKIPPAGADLTASYRTGGGTAGNVGLSITGNWPLQKSTYLVGLTDRGFQIRAVESLAEGCSGNKRPRYYEGQMLSASDLDTEQDYFLRQNRRHNRWLHGAGIVSGLEITVVGAESPAIVVSPGYAIDPYGRELLVREPISLCIPDQPSPQFVALRYSERETDLVPSPGQDRNVPSRIEDCVLALILAARENGEALTIGRLLNGAGGWEVDSSFQPQRSR
jgi:hypothetical protein